jgi:hypothetical protein
MLFICLPLADATLQWQPRWAGAAPAWQLLGWLLCLAPLALIVLLYRAELRLVRPPVARALLAARLASTAAVVAVLALQPVFHVTTTDTIRGRVIVALDRSQSMTIADPQRPLADKLRIARTLKLATDLCSESQLDSWIKEAGASGQIGFPLDGRGTDDRVRQTFDQVCRRIDALPRAGLGAAIVGESGGLLAAIEKKHDVALLGFSEAATVLPRELISQPPLKSGVGTDLGAPIDWAASGDSPPVAVVLLTDGRHNASASPVAKAAALGQLGAPVYSILLGARVPPPDVSIARVQAPASVFKGADATVESVIQVNGLGARELTLELQQPGRPTLTERIHHPGGSRMHTVRMSVRLDDPGAHPVTVRVRPEPEDTHPENDTRTVTIQAADDKAKVLLIDGEARWEHHYLASALSRDPSINVQSVVFAQPRIGRTIEADDEASALPARQLPRGHDALESFDAIVLGDVTPEQLGAADRDRLDRYVSERGGTLIVIAGKRAMPGSFFRASLDHDPLRKLLPIESARLVAAPNGFTVAPTADGKLSSFLQLDNTAEASAERWSDLPRHYWGVVGRAKPGAAVLATEREPAASETGNWEKDHALIAWHNVGFGRVLFVGIESTWRFRLRTGDAIHHRLWGQVLRWAAADQPLIVGNSTVRFGPRRPLVQQGDDIEIAVRWLDNARPLKTTSAAVRVLHTASGKPDEQVAVVPLSKPEASRDLTARLRDLPPGDYAAELAIPDRANDLTVAGPNGVMAPLRAKFRVTPRESTELSDLSCDVGLLEEIAAKSGGRVFAAEEFAELAPLLTSRSVTRDVQHEWRLAESWLTLGLLLTLLGFEWGLRKWAGLP